MTAKHREAAFKHRIVLVDPFRSVTSTPDTFNPLDAIQVEHPLAIDDCNDLASALVVRTGRETEAHWNDSAEALIAAVLATAVGYGEKETRSLASVREIISVPQHLAWAVQLMSESDKMERRAAPPRRPDPALCGQGESQCHFHSAAALAVHRDARDRPEHPHQQLRPQPHAARADEHLSDSPARPRRRADGPAADVGRVAPAGLRTGGNVMNPVHFVLDEAAMLGPMTSIDNAVGIGRSYGIRL